MIDIKDMSLKELEGFLKGMGKESYRSSQIFKWLYKQDAKSFDEMTDLSKTFREELKAIAYVGSLEPIKIETSRDGTKKYLFRLNDGESIESVLIPEGKRRTLCISSQVGCPLDCGFCLTGSMGFKRNLTTSEITGQVLAVNKSLEDDLKITNIVYMGMGEPLLNFEHVLRSIEIISGDKSIRISPRKVTLSTAGVVPQMLKLGEESNVNLAVSLNATTDEVRDKIMPVNKKYPIAELLDACRNYPLSNRRRITFEYVLIKDLNDSLDDAKRIVKLLRGIPAKVNLLPFNESEGSPFKRPSKETIQIFHNYLENKNMTVIIRSSKGSDISAACGQLKGKVEKEAGIK